MKHIEATIRVVFEVPDNVENVNKAQIAVDKNKVNLWLDGDLYENGFRFHDLDSIREIPESEVTMLEFQEAKDLVNERSLPYDPANYFRRWKGST